MSKAGNVMQLSSLLQAKTEADRAQIEQQTRQQLEQHAESLEKLSAEGLNTTKSVIDSRTKAMTASLNTSKKQIEEQHRALSEEIEKQTKRLLWLMKWPILGTLAVCLALCGLTWAYWRLAAPYKTVTTESGHTWQVMKGEGWRMCDKQPCRPIGND